MFTRYFPLLWPATTAVSWPRSMCRVAQKKRKREGTTRGHAAIGEAVRLIEESAVRSMNLLPVTISTVASGD